MTSCTNAPAPPRILHCWAERTPAPIGACDCPCNCGGPGIGVTCDECTKRCWWGVRFSVSATCMLPRGHEDACDFTDDDRISVTFANGSN